MTQIANISISGFFFNFAKKPKSVLCFLPLCMFFIFVITCEPNQIQTRLAPQIQNDRLNLSFMKDIHVEHTK